MRRGDTMGALLAVSSVALIAGGLVWMFLSPLETAFVLDDLPDLKPVLPHALRLEWKEAVRSARQGATWTTATGFARTDVPEMPLSGGTAGSPAAGPVESACLLHRGLVEKAPSSLPARYDYARCLLMAGTPRAAAEEAKSSLDVLAQLRRDAAVAHAAWLRKRHRKAPKEEKPDPRPLQQQLYLQYLAGISYLTADDPSDALRHLKNAIGDISAFIPDTERGEIAKSRQLTLETDFAHGQDALATNALYQALIVAYLSAENYDDKASRINDEFRRPRGTIADDFFGRLHRRSTELYQQHKLKANLAIAISNVQRVRYANEAGLPASWLALEGIVLAKAAEVFPEEQLKGDLHAKAVEDLNAVWQMKDIDAPLGRRILAWSDIVLDAGVGALSRDLLENVLKDDARFAALSKCVGATSAIEKGDLKQVTVVLSQRDIPELESFKPTWFIAVMHDLAEESLRLCNETEDDALADRASRFGLWALSQEGRRHGSFVWNALTKKGHWTRARLQARASLGAFALWCCAFAAVLGALITWRIWLAWWRFDILCRRSFFRQDHLRV